MTKYTFKGLWTGVKIFKKLQTYQIIKSTLLDTDYDINHVSVDTDNDKIYIYHSYNNMEKYSGRWYNTNLTNDQYELDNNAKTFVYIIPEYERELENNIIIEKDVKATIYFTEKGYKKFTNILKNLF